MINLHPQAHSNHFTWRKTLIIIIIIVIGVSILLFYQLPLSTDHINHDEQQASHHKLSASSETEDNEAPQLATLSNHHKRLWQALLSIKHQQIQSLSLFNHLFNVHSNSDSTIYFKQVIYKPNELSIDIQSKEILAVKQLISILDSAQWLNTSHDMQFKDDYYQSQINLSANIGLAKLGNKNDNSPDAIKVTQLLEANKKINQPISNSSVLQTLHRLNVMHNIKLIQFNSVPNRSNNSDSDYFINHNISIKLSAKLSNIILFIKGLHSSSVYYQFMQWKIAHLDDGEVSFDASLQTYQLKQSLNYNELTQLFKQLNASENTESLFPYIVINTPKKPLFQQPLNNPNMSEGSNQQPTLYKFLGTMQKQQQTAGLIEDKNGRIYTLSVGNFMPHSQAIVSAVSQQSITFVEPRHQINGEWQTIERKLVLPTN